MSEQLILYTNPNSRGRIARWMLEEVGQPYATEVLAYGPEMRTETYLALNPMGKVPTLQHGDVVITETAAICAYLADAFPEAGLAPPPPARGTYYRWLFFCAGPVEAAATDKTLGAAPATPQQEGMAGYGTLDRVVETLANRLAASVYVAGDAFTAADVYVGAHVGWGMMFGTLPERPEFQAYWDRVSDREAYRRAKAADDRLEAEAAST